MSTAHRTRAGAVGLSLVAALAGTSLLAGCSQASTQHASDERVIRHDRANDTYGSLPSWLPRNGVDNNAPLTGRPGRPAVTSEGDEVRASVDGAHVIAEIDGPVVPGEGLPDPPAATTCTWRVTVHVTGGSLPLSVRDFNALDHLGTIYRVDPVAGQRPVPRTVRPGRPASFELRAVMPTGEGVMRWSPDRRTILGEWDFTVEND